MVFIVVDSLLLHRLPAKTHCLVAAIPLPSLAPPLCQTTGKHLPSMFSKIFPTNFLEETLTLYRTPMPTALFNVPSAICFAFHCFGTDKTGALPTSASDPLCHPLLSLGPARARQRPPATDNKKAAHLQ